MLLLTGFCSVLAQGTWTRQLAARLQLSNTWLPVWSSSLKQHTDSAFQNGMQAKDAGVRVDIANDSTELSRRLLKPRQQSEVFIGNAADSAINTF